MEDISSARILINSLKHSDLDGLTQTICFVIMPDHMHWLFQLKSQNSLSSVMAKVKGRTSFLINKANNKQIWQPGFYDSLIRDEAHLIAEARYIVANPLRASLVEYIGDYPFWDCIYLK